MVKKYVENQWNRTFGQYPNKKKHRPLVYYVFPYKNKQGKLEYKYSLNPLKIKQKLPISKVEEKVLREKLRNLAVNMGMVWTEYKQDALGDYILDEKGKKIPLKPEEYEALSGEVNYILDNCNISLIYNPRLPRGKFNEKFDDIIDLTINHFKFIKDDLMKINGAKDFVISDTDKIMIKGGNPFQMYSYDYYKNNIKPFMKGFNENDINIYSGYGPLWIERPDGFIYSLAPRIDTRGEGFDLLKRLSENNEYPPEHMLKRMSLITSDEEETCETAISILETMVEKNYKNLDEYYAHVNDNEVSRFNIHPDETFNKAPKMDELKERFPKYKQKYKRDILLLTLNEGLLTPEELGISAKK